MGREFGSRLAGQRRPGDNRPPVGENEGETFLSRTQPLIDEMAKQLEESERVLAHYQEQPDVPYAMRQPATDVGPSLNEPPIPSAERPVQEPGGVEDRGRPGAFQFGMPSTEEPSPVRPGGMQPGGVPARLKRPVTRSGRAVREPGGAGGNTALRFQEPPTGFSLLSGGGPGGTVGPGSLEGLTNQGVSRDEMRRLYRRLGGR